LTRIRGSYGSPSSATEGWDYAQQYAAAIEADPAADFWTPLFTSHGYTASGFSWAQNIYTGLTASNLNALRNLNGSVAVVVLDTATTGQTAAFSLRGTGAFGLAATPYLTGASHDTAAQPGIGIRGGLFTATLPARSLVTYVIPARP